MDVYIAAAEEILPIFIPIIALVIPVVAILTKHQQKMAELVRQSPQLGSMPEVHALRQEVAQMRQMMNDQMLALDQIRSALPARTEPPAIPQIEQKL